MIVTHMSALLLTFFIYAVLAVAYLGWGRITARLLGLKEQERCFVTHLIWMGWAFTLLLFQLIHFVLPLTGYAVIPVLIGGTAFAIPHIVRALRSYTPPPSMLIPVILGAVAIIVVSWI